jgi:replicative DNA helicase
MGAPNLSCPEAERSVLAAVLMEPHRLPDVRELLRVEDFEDPRHAATFRAICQLDDSSAPISELGADAILKADKKVSPPEGGWLHYLAEMLLAVTSAARLTYHCTIVAESARLRRLVTACRAAAEEAATIRPGQGEADEFIDETEARIFEIGQRGFGACKGFDMSEVSAGRRRRSHRWQARAWVGNRSGRR